MAQQAGEERTLGQLVADAGREMSELVRYEIALAKAELRSEVKHVGLAGGLFAVAGYLAFLASILLVIAAGFGLVAAGLSPWLGFLVLAVALLLLTAVLALVGKSRISRLRPPERTNRSLKALAELKPGTPNGVVPGAVVAADRPATDRGVADRMAGNGVATNGARRDGPQEAGPR
jgi:Putative Actinobacterial Holin-X, holin superfamily III